MMGDAIDGAFEDDEDESDAIMSQVRKPLHAGLVAVSTTAEPWFPDHQTESVRLCLPGTR
jgi:hypothetical protein